MIDLFKGVFSSGYYRQNQSTTLKVLLVLKDDVSILIMNCLSHENSIIQIKSIELFANLLNFSGFMNEEEIKSYVLIIRDIYFSKDALQFKAKMCDFLKEIADSFPTIICGCFGDYVKSSM